MSEKERKKNSRVSHPAVPLAKALADQAMPDSELAGLLDGEALLVLREPLLAFVVRHLVEQHARALELDALHVVQRPHLRLVELDVRLRDQGVAVVADVAEILVDVGQVPAMVQGLPLALAGEPAHGGRRTAVVLLADGDLVRPAAGMRAAGARCAGGGRGACCPCRAGWAPGGRGWGGGGGAGPREARGWAAPSRS